MAASTVTPDQRVTDTSDVAKSFQKITISSKSDSVDALDLIDIYQDEIITRIKSGLSEYERPPDWSRTISELRSLLDKLTRSTGVPWISDLLKVYTGMGKRSEKIPHSIFTLMSDYLSESDFPMMCRTWQEAFTVIQCARDAGWVAFTSKPFIPSNDRCLLEWESEIPPTDGFTRVTNVEDFKDFDLYGGTPIKDTQTTFVLCGKQPEYGHEWWVRISDYHIEWVPNHYLELGCIVHSEDDGEYCVKLDRRKYETIRTVNLLCNRNITKNDRIDQAIAILNKVICMPSSSRILRNMDFDTDRVI